MRFSHSNCVSVFYPQMFWNLNGIGHQIYPQHPSNIVPPNLPGTPRVINKETKIARWQVRITWELFAWKALLLPTNAHYVVVVCVSGGAPFFTGRCSRGPPLDKKRIHEADGDFDRYPHTHMCVCMWGEMLLWMTGASWLFDFKNKIICWFLKNIWKSDPFIWFDKRSLEWNATLLMNDTLAFDLCNFFLSRCVLKMTQSLIAKFFGNRPP